jgi:hypothetical protein
VRATPFHRILAIYVAALLTLTIWFVARRPVARSAETVVRYLARAIQIKHAYAALRDDSDTSFPVQDHEVIQKSFSLAGAARKSIDIDNIWGSIEVVGGTSDQVELVVDKTIRAESKDALALAHKEVTLAIPMAA